MEAYKTVGSNMTLSNMFGVSFRLTHPFLCPTLSPILPSHPPLLHSHTSTLPHPHTPLHLNFFPHYSPFPLLVFILTMTLFNHLPWVLNSPWS